jgi:hypothetical protein
MSKLHPFPYDLNYVVEGLAPAIKAKITKLIEVAGDFAFMGASEPADEKTIEDNLHRARYDLEQTILTCTEKAMPCPSIKPEDDLNAVTLVNNGSYGHGNTIHYRGTMQVEYILDIVPGAWHQPEDLANWMADHPYITKVTYIPKEKPPLLLEVLKMVFDDAYKAAEMTGYALYTNMVIVDHFTLDVAHNAAVAARDAAFADYKSLHDVSD